MDAIRCAVLLIAVSSVIHCAADVETEVMGFKPIRQAYPEDDKLRLSGGKPDRRHNWCEHARTFKMHTNVSSGSRFKNTFQGAEVSVVFQSTTNDGYLHGTLESVLWDAVAKELGLKWQNSFAIVDPPKASDWDPWFAWAAQNYDFVVKTCTMTPERMAQGLRFSYPISDATLVIVGVVKETSAPFYSKMVSFLRPFQSTTWLTLVVFFGVTAWVYRRLEHDEGDGDYTDLEQKGGSSLFYQSLYVTISQFTGLGSFSAQTWLGKTFAISWSFMLLIVTSSYTANLASLLVVDDHLVSTVSSFEEAVARNMVICIGKSREHMILPYYPDANLKRVSSPVEGFKKIREGACVGQVVSVAQWELAKVQQDNNPDCNLGIIGGTIKKYDYSYVSYADAGQKCTDFLADTIAYALHDIRMQPNSLLHRAWESIVAHKTNMQCPSAAEGSRGSADSLGLEQLGGVMLIHIFVMTVCLLLDKMGFHGRGGSADAAKGSPPESSQRGLL